MTMHCRTQVDCLSGMGAMYRDNGQLRAAEGFMRQALRCAEALGDDVVRASCLTHLGSVLIASDAGAAIKHLEEAVQLREDQVGCRRTLCCCCGVADVLRLFGLNLLCMTGVAMWVAVLSSNLSFVRLHQAVCEQYQLQFQGEGQEHKAFNFWSCTITCAGFQCETYMRVLPPLCCMLQVVLLHDEGKRGSSLATAIMEHAGSLVSLAGAYYCSQRYVDAADAYSKSLAVFEMIDDTDKVVKCLINLANLYELQVRDSNV
jgi:tetratricopeptide (TPR) repeat protein